MASIALPGANSTFSYAGGNSAQLKVSQVGFTYGVDSTESHAREHRAFYPHRRNQGQFTVTIDNNQWAEFQAAMQWFKGYATAALDLDSSTVPPPMLVSVPSRNFLRYGIPIQGMSFGDFIGSMVFSPQLTFVSVSDPNDPSTAILSTSQVSGTDTASFTGDVGNYFYPDSRASNPGALATYLYDQNAAQISAEDAALSLASGNTKIYSKGRVIGE